MRRSFKLGMILGFLGVSMMGANSWAVFPTPSTFASWVQGDVNTVLQTVAVGSDFHSYLPASSLGVTGFDFGISGMYFALPGAFTTAISSATGTSITAAGLMFPWLSLHKGLPFGLDLGAHYVTVPGANGLGVNGWGWSLKWSFVDGGSMGPSLALSAQGSYNNFEFITTNTHTFDAMASFGLAFVQPYIGGGMEVWNGTVQVPAGATALPVGVSAQGNGAPWHFFAGLPLKLGLMKFSAEYDTIPSAGTWEAGGKFSFCF